MPSYQYVFTSDCPHVQIGVVYRKDYQEILKELKKYDYKNPTIDHFAYSKCNQCAKDLGHPLLNEFVTLIRWK